jgi:hypothetical protein
MQLRKEQEEEEEECEARKRLEETVLGSAERFREDAEREEDDRNGGDDDDDDEFARALREALEGVFCDGRRRRRKELFSLSKKSIASQTEQKVRKIVNKRLERVKKMTDCYAACERFEDVKNKRHKKSSDDDETSKILQQHVNPMTKEKTKKKFLKPGSSASTKRITKPLIDWMYENVHNPFPSKEEKLELSRTTGMSPGQISNWMINFRGRRLRPLVRELVSSQKKKLVLKGRKRSDDAS